MLVRAESQSLKIMDAEQEQNHHRSPSSRKTEAVMTPRTLMGAHATEERWSELPHCPLTQFSNQMATGVGQHMGQFYSLPNVCPGKQLFFSF